MLSVGLLTLLATAVAVGGCGEDEPTGPGPTPGDTTTPPVLFLDRTDEAGFRITRIPAPAPAVENIAISGGAAAGDVDGDGFLDVVIVREGSGDNLLYLNNGDGTFRDGSGAAGLTATPLHESGPTLVDHDGDGDLDLLMGGVREEADWGNHNSVLVLRNDGGVFTDVTAGSGLQMPPEVDTYGMSFADVDGDADLDVFLAHWRIGDGTQTLANGSSIAGRFLWLNTGAGTYVDGSAGAGLDSLEFTFNPTFSDVDEDGDADLLLVSDFNESKVFLNQGGVFTEETGSILTDGNGMGAAVGDYDRDGDFDWFVSSVWDPNGVAEGNWDTTGNRLYRNDGAGGFTDVTDAAGVREGFWGWGACFGDFDKDGILDLFHTNGMQVAENPIFAEFRSDPARLFMGGAGGTFTERSMDFGPAHVGQGRGVVCFDADRDGDLDILVANAGGPPNFYRNEGASPHNWLEIALTGPSPNTQGIGARITVVGSVTGTQVAEIRLGGNYVSHNPAEAHFGLGVDTEVDVTVHWPDGQMSTLPDVAANQVLRISHPSA